MLMRLTDVWSVDADSKKAAIERARDDLAKRLAAKRLNPTLIKVFWVRRRRPGFFGVFADVIGEARDVIGEAAAREAIDELLI